MSQETTEPSRKHEAKSRLQISLTAEWKAAIHEAASHQGQTVAEFVRESAQAAASRTIDGGRRLNSRRATARPLSMLS